MEPASYSGYSNILNQNLFGETPQLSHLLQKTNQNPSNPLKRNFSSSIECDLEVTQKKQRIIQAIPIDAKDLEDFPDLFNETTDEIRSVSHKWFQQVLNIELCKSNEDIMNSLDNSPNISTLNFTLHKSMNPYSMNLDYSLEYRDLTFLTKFNKIKVLDLTGCSTSSILPDFSMMKNLERLIIRTNRPKELFAQLSHIKSLSITTYSFDYIDLYFQMQLTHLEDLEMINLCGKRYQFEPETLKFYTNLTKLDEGATPLNFTVDELKKAIHLKKLDLRSHKYVSAVSSLTNLDDLRIQLVASEAFLIPNFYACFDPETINHLPKLKRLNIFATPANKIFNFSKSVLNQLTELSINYIPKRNHNDIFFNDDLLEKCENIESLWGNFNSINIKTWNKLQKLKFINGYSLERTEKFNDVDMKGFSNMPKDVLFYKKFKKLTDLTLPSKFTNQKNLNDFTHIQTLDLGFKVKLNYSNLDRLTQLKKLNINLNINYNSLDELIKLKALLPYTTITVNKGQINEATEKDIPLLK